MLLDRYSDENSKEVKALNSYKRRLLMEFLSLVLFCLLILLQRIFYQMMMHSEQQTLSKFQLETHLSTRNGGTYAPADILNPFYSFWGSLSQFNIQFLILTHAFVTMYVIDSQLTLKVMMASLGFTQCVTFLQLVYAGARPNWTSNNIFSSHCNSSFSHPDFGCALVVFVPSYTFFCWRERAKQISHSYTVGCNIFSIVSVIFAIILIQFINYVTGTAFAINMAMSVLICLFALTLLSFLDGRMEMALRTLSSKGESQSHQIKWIFLILCIFLFLQMAYSFSQQFPNIQWISNHLSCRKYTQQQSPLIAYDKIIGPWFTFKQSSISFAWIGLILAILYCSRKMRSRNWSKGTFKQRTIDIVVCNLLIIPSWIFELLLKEESWIHEMGLNSIIIDSIHYFILYLWLFGAVPHLVLSRIFKTVENLDYDSAISKQTE